MNNFAKLQQQVLRDLSNDEFQIIQGHGNIEYNGLTIAGYFDPIDRVFGYAIDNQDVFIHESCHYDQWREGVLTNEIEQQCKKVWDWLSGVNIDNLDDCINSCIYIELDCEIRAINKINEYNIPIDTKLYAQQANSYILFYNYLRKHRKWYNHSTSNTEVCQMLPTNMHGLDYFSLPKDYENLVTKHCF